MKLRHSFLSFCQSTHVPTKKWGEKYSPVGHDRAIIALPVSPSSQDLGQAHVPGVFSKPPGLGFTNCSWPRAIQLPQARGHQASPKLVLKQGTRLCGSADPKPGRRLNKTETHSCPGNVQLKEKETLSARDVPNRYKQCLPRPGNQLPHTHNQPVSNEVSPIT